MTSLWCTILPFRHDLKEKRDKNPFHGAHRPANSSLPHTLLPPGLLLIQKGIGLRSAYDFPIVFVL